MLKGCRAIPFRQAGLAKDHRVDGTVLPSPEFDKGLNCLQTAVVRTGVDPVHGRVGLDQVGGQLSGLVNSVRSQGWIGSYAGW